MTRAVDNVIMGWAIETEGWLRMCWLFHGDGLQPDGWPTEINARFGLRMVAQAMYMDLVRSGDETHRKVEVWDERLREVTGAEFDLRLLELALDAAVEAFEDHAGPEARARARAELLRHLEGIIEARDEGLQDEPLEYLDSRQWAARVLGLSESMGWD